jgi:uncharacterized hydrophobic protein (TIGR00271 family)
MNLLKQYFNLESDRDAYDTIHASIEKDILFRGTNLWILVFAIFLASVGLNINSTAVIIGAMLISPLMGPINGIGYSIAIYDFTLLRRSLINLAFAVGTSLITSTVYFTLSPISIAQSELLARTSPTIYDVLIALFGGLAGIVGISSRHKGNILPGVAIATALMPPLCTAGYGIASGQPTFFFGAFYLFTINAVFIALSSVVISQILDFPIRSNIDDTKKRRVNHVISAVITLTVVPSIYFGYLLVQKEKFVDRANRFVTHVSLFQGNFLIRNDINPADRRITLIYGGENLTDKQKEDIASQRLSFDLSDAEVVVKQGFSVDEKTGRSLETETLKAEISRLNQAIRQRDEQIETDDRKERTGKQLLSELTPLFPGVNQVAFGTGYRFGVNAETEAAMVSISAQPGLSHSDRQRITAWVKVRLGDQTAVYFE